MIPQNYEQWKNCIEKDCKIKLTKNFAAGRLKTYRNKRNPETQNFIKLYGQEHWKNIIKWLKMHA